MNTTIADRPKNVIKSDYDGYWYSLPPHEVQPFIYAVEATALAEWGSPEWDTACNELVDLYGKYKKEE